MRPRKRAEVALREMPTGGRAVESVKVSGDPFSESAARASLHEDAIDGHVYRAFLHDLREGTGLLESTAIAYAGDILDAMKPRDAMERMLVMHALWCHGRVLKLNLMLARATRLADVRTLSELGGRASNDFRKGMLALADYRRPKRSTVRFIGQLNTAKQQVVQNGGSSERKPRTVTARVIRGELPAAEVHETGARVTSRGHRKGAAVAAVNRTTKRRG